MVHVQNLEESSENTENIHEKQKNSSPSMESITETEVYYMKHQCKINF